jgi:hypothetical protein
MLQLTSQEVLDATMVALLLQNPQAIIFSGGVAVESSGGVGCKKN